MEILQDCLSLKFNRTQPLFLAQLILSKVTSISICSSDILLKFQRSEANKTCISEHSQSQILFLQVSLRKRRLQKIRLYHHLSLFGTSHCAVYFPNQSLNYLTTAPPQLQFYK